MYKGLITQLEDYNIWNEYTGKYTKAIYAYSGRWSLPACKAKNNEVCILSDKFLSCTHDEWQKIKEPNYCALRNDGLLHFFVDRTMSKENFNDWLSENPVTIYYELAKPIYTQI